MPSLGRSGKLFSETRDFSISLKAQFGQVHRDLFGKESKAEETTCVEVQMPFYFYDALHVFLVCQGSFLKKAEEKWRRQSVTNSYCAQDTLICTLRRQGAEPRH